ncbi:hypothetical protein VTK26DRAFT_3799 [Humicola hyalothermophila]
MKYYLSRTVLAPFSGNTNSPGRISSTSGYIISPDGTPHHVTAHVVPDLEGGNIISIAAATRYGLEITTKYYSLDCQLGTYMYRY